MSIFKDLNNITESERLGLQQLLLERINELEHKREVLVNGPVENHDIDSRIMELEKLIRFNSYMFYWLEDPPSARLQ